MEFIVPPPTAYRENPFPIFSTDPNGVGKDKLMKRIIFTGKQQVELENTPDPVPGPGKFSSAHAFPS